jgi:hypothetical protein
VQSLVLATAWTARALARVRVDPRRGGVLVVLGILSVDLGAAAVGADGDAAR